MSKFWEKSPENVLFDTAKPRTAIINFNAPLTLRSFKSSSIFTISMVFEPKAVLDP